MWDFSIQTDHDIEYNKPDIVAHDKMKRECIIIGVACPFDSRVDKKEFEKIKKYQDFKRELMMIWKFRKICIIPIITGALETLRNFKLWASRIEVYDLVDLTQKACVLGTAKIIRRVLDI